ncbi:lipoma-preferred partner homolog isoform X2 [Hydractinia symbiolongicarpus]|uniref:lipoma-preferred partner homolog isoform X2 n=1 Tax=Hydractinia symbiolongicarpus TaxID=13093 RepID=UPI00254C1740|nr:lipoma-preferred partner homolog isoform X2 [Hydractinia symbiolongicarpus]
MEMYTAESVRISVRQPAAKPLQKVPPPVKAKPAKVYPPSSAEVKTPTDEFPPPPPPEIMEKPAKSSVEDELDALTAMLALGLESTDDPDFYGVCHKCRKTIVGEGSGCTAMGDMYHVSCFVCGNCDTKLTGLEFYCLNDAPLCERCYMNSLEDCVVCKEKITERILKAVGSSYHPQCFGCSSCHKNLDGIPFTVDASNAVHCVECYQVKFSPRCAACDKLIMPSNEQGETVHIVSMQKNFHVECYKCEDCAVLLSSDEGRGCYPLDGHLLCQRCNGVRMQNESKRASKSSSQSTEL